MGGPPGRCSRASADGKAGVLNILSTLRPNWTSFFRVVKRNIPVRGVYLFSRTWPGRSRKGFVGLRCGSRFAKGVVDCFQVHRSPGQCTGPSKPSENPKDFPAPVPWLHREWHNFCALRFYIFRRSLVSSVQVAPVLAAAHVEAGISA